MLCRLEIDLSENVFSINTRRETEDRPTYDRIAVSQAGRVAGVPDADVDLQAVTFVALSNSTQCIRAHTGEVDRSHDHAWLP